MLDIYHLLKLKYTINAISVATAGQVNTSDGSIKFAGPTIPNYTGEKIGCFLKEETNLQVEVINDVNAALLSIETCNTLLIQIGTGIGGALTIDGNLYFGNNDASLEIGHMLINGKSFEQNCSSSSLCQKFSTDFNQEITGYDINKLFLEKNKKCEELLDKYFDSLAIGVANLISILDPSNILFGGGISEADFFDVNLIKKKAIKMATNLGNIENVEFDKIKFGNKAVLIGSSNYYRSKHDKKK